MSNGELVFRNKVLMTLVNGTGYVFNANDYMVLRRYHRIVGALVGTNGSCGWSARESTLPAELTPWETQLLLDEDIGILVSKSESLLSIPAIGDMERYTINFENRIQEQINLLKAQKLQEAERNLDKIISGKRRKLSKSGLQDCEIHLQPCDILREIGDKVVFDRNNALVEVPMAHPETHTIKIVGLSDSVSKNTLKHLVFRDLWQQGNYVTAGDIFGADFLIYPGDPLLYHASHVVILLSEPTADPLTLITKVRLSVVVNKICVFAYTDPAKRGGRVKYQTVTWYHNH